VVRGSGRKCRRFQEGKAPDERIVKNNFNYPSKQNWCESRGRKVRTFQREGGISRKRIVARGGSSGTYKWGMERGWKTTACRGVIRKREVRITKGGARIC